MKIDWATYPEVDMGEGGIAVLAIADMTPSGLLHAWAYLLDASVLPQGFDRGRINDAMTAVVFEPGLALSVDGARRMWPSLPTSVYNAVRQAFETLRGPRRPLPRRRLVPPHHATAWVAWCRENGKPVW